MLTKTLLIAASLLSNANSFTMMKDSFSLRGGSQSDQVAQSPTLLVLSEDFGDIFVDVKPELLMSGNAHEGPVYIDATEDSEDYYLFITSPESYCDSSWKCRFQNIQIMKFDPRTKTAEIWRNDSNMANGNVIDNSGRNLFTCEQGNNTGGVAQISRTDLVTGKVSPLVSSHAGLPFNSPNDIVQKSDGSVWFTDPPYGYHQGFRPKPAMGSQIFAWQPSAYHEARGSTRVVVDDMWVTRPNGLAFSPREDVLYVTDSGSASGSPGVPLDPSGPHRILAFDVLPGNHLGAPRVFATVFPGIPDGIKVDRSGNVYSSAGDGVHVFNRRGDLLGKILISEGATNFVFGGPRRDYLLIVSNSAVYGLQMK